MVGCASFLDCLCCEPSGSAVDFAGLYADVEYPGCPRRITTTSATQLSIIGHDGDTSEWWTGYGVAKGKSITINLSAKGGPAELVGFWTGTGIRWVKQDGVKIRSDRRDDWYKDDVLKFAGIYADIKHPGCPRIITFTSTIAIKVRGHDGDPSQPWKCNGIAKGDTIALDLTNHGGPSNLVGKLTDTGIRWAKNIEQTSETFEFGEWVQDEALNFEGLYADRAYPGCPRFIMFTSATELTISGHDGDPGRPWKCSGFAKGATIIVDLSRKGGPSCLQGTWTGSGIKWIEKDGWPLDITGSIDWYKDDALNFIGTYADVRQPGCPRVVRFVSATDLLVTGHDGDPKQSWVCRGIAKGRSITVDLSPIGGPFDSSGIWTGTGIRWLHDGISNISNLSDVADDWFKDEAMCFDGLYADIKFPGCPRRVVFTSATDLMVVGHNGDPHKPWTCSAVVNGNSIIVNLSNAGGPANLEGRRTDNGIRWIKDDGVPIDAGHRDDWYKNEALSFEGIYSEVGNPGCPRSITFISASDVVVTGHDGDHAKHWKCLGVANGSSIVVDFTPKAGPSRLEGIWTGDGISWAVARSDSCKEHWIKNDSMYFDGIYADIDFPGCPRCISFATMTDLRITGHDGDPTRPWTCNGVASRNSVTIDFSSRGGPANLKGEWTGTGIHWLKDTAMLSNSDRHDDWYKDVAMNFAGVFADVNNPGCPRMIRFTSASELLVSGHDGDSTKPWTCIGTAKNSTIMIEPSSNGRGLQRLEGKWTGTGICWTIVNGVPSQNDGSDGWYKEDAMNFDGAYADASCPGCPRIITFTSAVSLVVVGHDGDPSRPWKCTGVASGKTITVDFSSKGGPRSLDGSWTGTGIRWNKTSIVTGAKDDWHKSDAMKIPGMYADVEFPGCPRMITFSSSTEFSVVGHDGDPGNLWICRGFLDEDYSMRIDLSGKGGCGFMQGMWTGTGIRWRKDERPVVSAGSDSWYKDEAMHFSGIYSDTRNPGCARIITFTSATDLKITGHDGDPAQPWTCSGVANGDTLVVNLSKKGGPYRLEGKWTGTGICWVKEDDVRFENDGSDSWFKDDTLNFAGIYSEAERPECPRNIAFISATEVIISGHEGDVKQSWKCSGTAQGRKITVNLSRKGGPSHLEGVWTGTGIHWLKEGEDPTKASENVRDDWIRNEALNFVGVYADVDYPGCPRIIKYVSSSEMVVCGHDGDPSRPWTGKAITKGHFITVDFSSKGGPTRLQGKWTGRGIRWVQDAEISIADDCRHDWYKDDAMNFCGTYADVKHPGCPRVISFVTATEVAITGHDGDPTRPWICEGVANGGTIIVNLSSKGGPSRLVGKWTGTGICWVNDDGVIIRSDGEDSWYKEESLNFCGIYADVQHPGCPRTICFVASDVVEIIGHDGNPARPWKCKGVVRGNTIIANFSGRGGPANMEGRFIGNGITWIMQGGVPIGVNNKNTWYKDAGMNFAGAYTDAEHIGFPRFIRFVSASQVEIIGHEGDPAKLWKSKGVVEGSSIAVDLSSQGGPTRLQGNWTGTSISWVTSSGSDSWIKDSAMNFCGIYADASGPWPRIITFASASELIVTGHDGDPLKPWKCFGVASGNTISLNLSGKGGPASLEGIWTGTGICWVMQESNPIKHDGSDSWYKYDAMNFGGTFSDTGRPGCPRTITFISASQLRITGHDGNALQPWTCSGAIRGDNISVDLSKKGGPRDLEGRWTGTGICWVRADGVDIENDGSDGWRKENHDWCGFTSV